MSFLDLGSRSGADVLTFVRINAVLVGLVMIFNGMLMLVSPRAWARLPNWIRVHGFWFEAKWASGSSVQIRLTGAFLLALIIVLAVLLIGAGPPLRFSRVGFSDLNLLGF